MDAQERARGNELRDRGDGCERELHIATTPKPVDRVAKVFDTLKDLVNLIEYGFGFDRRHEQTGLAFKQSHAEGLFCVLNKTRNTRRRNVQ